MLTIVAGQKITVFTLLRNNRVCMVVSMVFRLFHFN